MARLVPNRNLDIEELAKAIHEDYCTKERASGQTPETNSSLLPWDRLSEEMRDASRAQAADIPNKLWMLGYELTTNQGLNPSDLHITEQQNEELAMWEHQRWTDEKRRTGWTYAPLRHNARKRHNLLVPWEALPENEKEKDRNTVRNLPSLVSKAGFRLRKIQ